MINIQGFSYSGAKVHVELVRVRVLVELASRGRSSRPRPIVN